MPRGFHARFDARGKIYRYEILNSKTDKPLMRHAYHKVPCRLNVRSMRKAAAALRGRRDFRAFQAKSSSSPIKDTVRTITDITIAKRGEFLTIEIEGDGFLHSMVRSIVGTLIEVGRGYLPVREIEAILRSRDRRKAGPTVPAKGLTLVKVKY
jgi:tRNA pseudouridine38-40 synthase